MKITLHTQAGNELPYSNISVTTEHTTNDITIDNKVAHDIHMSHQKMIGAELKLTNMAFINTFKSLKAKELIDMMMTYIPKAKQEKVMEEINKILKK